MRECYFIIETWCIVLIPFICCWNRVSCLMSINNNISSSSINDGLEQSGPGNLLHRRLPPATHLQHKVNAYQQHSLHSRLQPNYADELNMPYGVIAGRQTLFENRTFSTEVRDKRYAISPNDESEFIPQRLNNNNRKGKANRLRKRANTTHTNETVKQPNGNKTAVKENITSMGSVINIENKNNGNIIQHNNKTNVSTSNDKNDGLAQSELSSMNNEIPIDQPSSILNDQGTQQSASNALKDIGPCITSTPCDCHTLPSKLNHFPLKAFDCTGLQLKDESDMDSNALPLWTEILKLSSNRLDMLQFTDLKPYAHLKELYLDGNHIYSLQKWEPLSTSLSYLNLERNELVYLGNGTFMGLENLLYLSTSQNKIEVIHKNALLGLRKLEVLIFSHNRISEIDVRWFRNLDSVTKLDLRGNDVHTLEDGSLRYLTKLTKLDLSDNHLHSVHNKAFIGLKQLKELYLQHNNIQVAPADSLRIFSHITTIDLSSNLIEYIEPYTFHSINVTELKLNQINTLKMIDMHSFVNLPYLKYIQIKDNKKLTYIDRNAFVNATSLEILLLNDNALTAVEKEIALSLCTSVNKNITVKHIDISNNPFYCDCVMLWFSDKQFLHNNSIAVSNANLTACDLPVEMSGEFLQELRLKSAFINALESQGCAPRIISALIQTDYNASLGDSLTINCKATGIPLPVVSWHLPVNHRRKLEKAKTLSQKSSNGETYNNSGNVRHSGILHNQLVIHFAEKEDGGNYSCSATNSLQTVFRNTLIRIQMSSAYLILSKLTATSVTMTWGRTHHARDYEIYFHPYLSSSNFTYRSIKIQPYMREYTLSGLHPNTKYRICISVNYLGKHIPINCTDVNTRNAHFMDGALHNSKNFVVTAAISILLIIVLMICSIGYCSRRYNKKKERQQQLYTDSLTQLFPASLDSISDTTPITYENKIAEMYDLENAFESGEGGSICEQTTTTA